MRIKLPWRRMLPALFALSVLLFGAFRSQSQTIIFYDNFETNSLADTNKWKICDAFDFEGETEITNAWGIVDRNFGGEGTISGNYKVYCAGNGNMGNYTQPMYSEGTGGSSMATALKTTIDLTAYTNAMLSFWYKMKIPDFEYLDYMIVKANDEEVFTTWDITPPEYGPCSEWSDETWVNMVPYWQNVSVSLREFAGQTVTLSFEFWYDEANAIDEEVGYNCPTVYDYHFEGIYLDDVSVIGYLNDYWPDYNTDGNIDLYLRHTNGTMLAACLDGGIGFVETGIISGGKPMGTNWSVAGYSDFDNNGCTDILFQNNTDGTLRLWYLQNITNLTTNVTFQAKGGWTTNIHEKIIAAYIGDGAIATPPAGYKVRSINDFNNDGKRDLILQDGGSSGGYIVVWTMDGTNLLESIPIRPGSTGYPVVSCTDVDMDGNKDFLNQNGSTGIMYYWKMNGTNYVSQEYVYLDAASNITWHKNWVPCGVWDFTGDNLDDILVQNSTNKEMQVWTRGWSLDDPAGNARYTRATLMETNIVTSPVSAPGVWSAVGLK